MRVNPSFAATLALLLALIYVGSVIPADAQTSSQILTSPDSGPVGTPITMTGQGFPPSTTLNIYWETLKGEWVLPRPQAESDPSIGHEHEQDMFPGEALIFHGHDFLGSSFTLHRYVIASIKSDASGSFSFSLKAPYDFGGRHWMIVTDKDNSAELSKAVFTILPSFSVSPNEGSPGTAITIRASGLGYGIYSTNYHVLWDNKYVGYASAVTTQGNATFTIYAAGDLGKHFIDIYEGYPGPAYLNIQEAPQNPLYYNPPYIPFHTEFTITPSRNVEGNKTAETLSLVSLGTLMAGLLIAPLAQRRHGQTSRRSIIPTIIIITALILAGTTLSAMNTISVSAQPQPKSSELRPQFNLSAQVTSNSSVTGGSAILSVNPVVATVGSSITITGSGLPSAANMDLLWSTKKGSYLRGWDDVVLPLGSVTTDSNGKFSFNMKVPHDLEGMHEISVKSKDVGSNVKNTGIYITRSAAISPNKGPSGTDVEVKMAGVGWTFVTNIVTVLYDNTFVGYACGFNSLGNVTLSIKAVGKPGIHTIDIYPSIYDGPPQGKANSIYRYPLLTPQDHPVRSPAFHFEFIITESDQQSGDNTVLTPQSLSIGIIAVGVVSLIMHNRSTLQTSQRRSI